MNNTPKARGPEHAQAFEDYRLSQVQLNKWVNNHRTGGGLLMAEYQKLVEARDEARAAVDVADPKPRRKPRRRNEHREDTRGSLGRAR